MTTPISYSFNYNGSPDGPIIGEVQEFKNIELSIGFAQPLFITYTLSHSTTNVIKGPVELLVLSTTNMAHSICEFISFLKYYKNLSRIVVGINSIVVNKMPYLYQFIQIFIPTDNILVLQNNSIYSFQSLTMRRNDHFIYTTNWSDCIFKRDGNKMIFEHLESIRNTFSINCTYIFDTIKNIYDTHKHKYSLNDSIMIIKTTKERFTVSPGRAILYPDTNTLEALNARGIKIIEISDFIDIYEYICTIYHAKQLIFSYGGPMCINRFFCNPEANIIVLANMHYRPEYEYENESQAYWHLRTAMLSPVHRQIFLLDFPNELTISSLDSIVFN